MKVKYVMTEKGPIIFPESFNHNDFGRFCPTSAGFVQIETASVHAYGSSVSLKMGYVDTDTSQIENLFKEY